ncbi:MAG: GDSL-type esterase/lipase family protein [Oscillospiraceae bacterium]|jgi:lysophospholipase L1-like esterase
MLKKFLTTLTAFVIFCTFICSPALGAQNSDDVHSLLILGDSISTGYGLEGYPETRDTAMSYANQLVERFSAPECFTNMAIDGQTSSELLEKLKNNDYDELIGSSDVIVVTIGGNDILYLLVRTLMLSVGLDENASFSELSEIDFTDENVLKQIGFYLMSGSFKTVIDESVNGFHENFIEISDYIYTENPKAVVIYQTVYNPMSGVDDLSAVDAMCEAAISGINSAFQENIWADSDMTERRYFIADVYNDFLQKGEELTRIRLFDIHPNADGHNRIYEICEELICEALDSEQTALQPQATTVTTAATTEYSQKDDSVENPCFGEVCDISDADSASAQQVDTGIQEKDDSIFSGKEPFIIVVGAMLIILLAAVIARRKSNK